MRRALITGANRGIGLELSRQLLARGTEVIGACRSSSPELDELAAASGAALRIASGVEVTSDDGVAALRAALGTDPLDLLINNAGLLLHGDTFAELDLEGIRRQFEINAVGPLRVTRALLGNLRQGSKIALITSRMGSIGDNTSGARYGYRMSKAALNMAGVSLAHDLRPQGIAVAILHPGFVRTGMTGGQGLVDADESARGLLARIDELDLASSGGFWHANGERLPW